MKTTKNAEGSFGNICQIASLSYSGLPVAFKVTLKRSCSMGYHRVPMCLELVCFSNFISTTLPLFCGLLMGPHHDQRCSELLLISAELLLPPPTYPYMLVPALT